MTAKASAPGYATLYDEHSVGFAGGRAPSSPFVRNFAMSIRAALMEAKVDPHLELTKPSRTTTAREGSNGPPRWT
jgi:hypothetical protein